VLTVSANRSGDHGGHYPAAENSNCTEDETILQQFDIAPYAQQQPADAIGDFIALTPASAIVYDDSPTTSHISYTQLQPL